MAEGNGVAVAPEIEELGKRIVSLTVAQAVALGKYLEDVHGIKPAAGGVAMMPQTGAQTGTAAPAPVEQTEFTVSLDGLADPTKKIGVIKVVRELTNLGLKEAKDLVEGAPKAIKENVAKDEANTIKKKLEDAGAKVSLK